MNTPTITIRGREYTVTVEQDMIDAAGRPYYKLTGKRGAEYGTMRNADPTLMFLLSLKRGSLSVQPLGDVWLTDADGVLELAETYRKRHRDARLSEEHARGEHEAKSRILCPVCGGAR